MRSATGKQAAWALSAILASVLGGAAAAQENNAAAPEIDSKTLESAGKYVDRYDTDKNGTLEESEWSAMTVKPTDYNGDQRVTKEELARRILEDRAARSAGSASSAPQPAATPAAENTEQPTNPASSAGANSSSAGESRAGGSPSDATPPTAATSSPPARPNRPARRSYRILTPRERLPSGLPDFFASRDRDGDGQVMMFEFASRWTEATVREFAEYDLNNDGVITVSECLRRQKRDGR